MEIEEFSDKELNNLIDSKENRKLDKTISKIEF